MNIGSQVDPEYGQQVFNNIPVILFKGGLRCQDMGWKILVKRSKKKDKII